MTDLTDFAADGGDPEPPHVAVQGAVKAPHGDATRVVGMWGHCEERGALAYVSERDSERHRLRALDAYAISTYTLELLTALRAEYVFIAETDTGDVYEYELADFTEYGDLVPERFLEDTNDPQRYATRAGAWRKWSNHAGDLQTDG